MIIIRSRFLPPKKYDAINILGLFFCRPGLIITSELINHERIHTAQMLEMGIIFYYIWYFIEWLIRLPMKGRAYENLSFEREAYKYMYDMNYLKARRHYAWIHFLS
ncbi:MAG: hypothetical protein IJV27_02250 [Prevotella sp.]|nr:hypothetical protein [Prevotella sp.]